MPSHIKAALTATSLSIPDRRTESSRSAPGRASTSGSTAGAARGASWWCTSALEDLIRHRRARSRARRAARRQALADGLQRRPRRNERTRIRCSRCATNGRRRARCASARGLQPIDARLVHAQHDLDHPSPAAAERTLQSPAQVVAAVQRKPGAFVVYRIRDARREGRAGEHHRLQHALSRRATLEGGERAIAAVEDPPKHDERIEARSARSPSPPPPRTSTPSARASGTRSTPTSPTRARPGCPDIILHGTATLALSVSKV